MECLVPTVVLSADSSSSAAHAAVATSIKVNHTSQLELAPWTWKGAQAGVYDNVYDDLDTTPHVWTYGEPVSIEPEGYYAGLHQVSDGNTAQLYDWQSPQAGVYENAWGDLDTTPHVWTGYGPPGSIEPEGYYADLAQTHGQTTMMSDGTCNTMPGWEVNWNPPSGGSCTLNPMYNQPGLGDGASYGSGYHQLAVPAGAETANTGTQDKTQSKTRPSPGHLMLMGHSMIFGAASATSQLFEDCLSGKKDAWSQWQSTFSSKSQEAAESVTPIGGYVLREHILKQE